jgi:hypothetical protein
MCEKSNRTVLVREVGPRKTRSDDLLAIACRVLWADRASPDTEVRQHGT